MEEGFELGVGRLGEGCGKAPGGVDIGVKRETLVAGSRADKQWFLRYISRLPDYDDAISFSVLRRFQATFR